MTSQPGFIVPDWPVPDHVHAASTLRSGGFSQGPFAGLNLAEHVNDDPHHVLANREAVELALRLPGTPAWLEQTHGNTAVHADMPGHCADASFTCNRAEVCVVLTADCLPVLFCDIKGHCVAAAHAGWRGLAAGVMEAALKGMHIPPDCVMAWLGPCIGPEVFEVGENVVNSFPGQEDCFRPTGPGKWLADLPELARQRLKKAGINQVFGGEWCTYSDPESFYSYRREKTTGRMGTLIWMSHD